MSDTDTLRDRIATAIYRSTCTRYDDYPWESAADYVKEVYGKQADAVIADLNLSTLVVVHPVVAVVGAYTDWKADDE